MKVIKSDNIAHLQSGKETVFVVVVEVPQVGRMSLEQVDKEAGYLEAGRLVFRDPLVPDVKFLTSKIRLQKLL